MPKVSARIEITQQAKVDVRLSANARAMLKARTEEHARLSKEIKEREGRKKRIQGEVDEIMSHEDQGEALLDGVTVDGFRMKLVCGSSSKLNIEKLKRKFNLTQADIDSCTDTTDNTPYVRITPPGHKGGDE